MLRTTVFGLLALTLLLGASSSVVAQDIPGMGGPMMMGGGAVPLTLNAVGGSGASGWAWLAPTPDGKVVATVLLTGVAPGSAHANHIHTGTCAQRGGIVYPFTDLVANDAGVAVMASLINADIQSLMGGANYVYVHAGSPLSAPGAAEGIACADIPAGMMSPSMLGPMMPGPTTPEPTQP